MKTIDYVEESIPTWAVNYLYSGDASGMTSEQVCMADNWRDAMLERKPDGAVASIDFLPQWFDAWSDEPAFGGQQICAKALVMFRVPPEDKREAVEVPAIYLNL